MMNIYRDKHKNTARIYSHNDKFVLDIRDESNFVYYKRVFDTLNEARKEISNFKECPKKYYVISHNHKKYEFTNKSLARKCFNENKRIFMTFIKENNLKITDNEDYFIKAGKIRETKPIIMDSYYVYLYKNYIL